MSDVASRRSQFSTPATSGVTDGPGSAVSAEHGRPGRGREPPRSLRTTSPIRDAPRACRTWLAAWRPLGTLDVQERSRRRAVLAAGPAGQVGPKFKSRRRRTDEGKADLSRHPGPPESHHVCGEDAPTPAVTGNKGRHMRESEGTTGTCETGTRRVRFQTNVWRAQRGQSSSADERGAESSA